MNAKIHILIPCAEKYAGDLYWPSHQPLATSQQQFVFQTCLFDSSGQVRFFLVHFGLLQCIERLNSLNTLTEHNESTSTWLGLTEQHDRGHLIPNKFPGPHSCDRWWHGQNSHMASCYFWIISLTNRTKLKQYQQLWRLLSVTWTLK